MTSRGQDHRDAERDRALLELVVHTHHLETGAAASHLSVMASQSPDLHAVTESRMLSTVEVVIRCHHRDIMHQRSNGRVGHHDDVGHHLHDDDTHLRQGAGRAHLYAGLDHHHHCLAERTNMIAVQNLQ